MKLSFNDYFVIEEEEEKVFVAGKIKCSCGCEKFKIFHTGKQTKGILASHIVKMQKQILIEAKCSRCGKIIPIYDTCVDGENPIANIHLESKEFLHQNIEDFSVKVLLNYNEENYMTNKFFTIYVHLINDIGKEIILYEE